MSHYRARNLRMLELKKLLQAYLLQHDAMCRWVCMYAGAPHMLAPFAQIQGKAYSRQRHRCTLYPSVNLS